MHERGQIPGPSEDKSTFLARISQAQPVDNRPMALERLDELFGMRPDWIEVSYSNRGLLPWQGGITEIGEGMRIQVRKSFEIKRTLFGIYSRDEIIAHEMVHGMRMAFDEPKFEEILAYQTSRSRFRRYFGPLFRSSKESSLLLVSSFALCIPGCWPLPLILGAYYLYRLVKGQRVFRRCLKKVPLALAIYLTDWEISHFAKWPKERIREYIGQQTSFRWQQIRSSGLMDL